MYIVGQTGLLKKIDHLIDSGKFPQFSIITGINGSGKKLISNYIAKRLNANFVPCGISVDDVREIVNSAYTFTDPMVYMWANADTMSLNAKNAVLKVVEEPPHNAYFIMTTENSQGLLGTLFSRGQEFIMEPYTTEQLREYINNKQDLGNVKSLEKVLTVANTPADIVTLSTQDITYMLKVVDILCQNIQTTNLANILKISTFLKYKEDDKDKLDPLLFARTYMCKMLELMKQHPSSLHKELIQITSTYIADLNNRFLNKQITVDNWLLDLYIKATGGVNI